jgi:plasmid stabilization system protein ParE
MSGYGVRVFQVEQHVIVYRVTAKEIRVSRILHVRRDIVSQMRR